MDDSVLDTSFCSEISFCMSEADENPQSVHIDLVNGSPLNENDFLVVHWNINSIRAEGRLEELIENVRVLKANVIVLSETKLDDTVPNNIISIPGFHEPIRKDRNRCGGGTLIYISQRFTFKQQLHLQSDSFEHISVDVRVNNDIYSINCYYRPPNEDNHAIYLEETEKILSRLDYHNAKTKLILSDLNFGNIYCKYPVLSPKPLDTSAPEIFSLHNFTQLIDIPTRTATLTINEIKHTTVSLIDLIFTNNDDNITKHGTTDPIADHDGIFVSFHCKMAKEKVISKDVFDYKNIDEIGLRNYIKDFDFESSESKK
jgi:hypothetical protein